MERQVSTSDAPAVEFAGLDARVRILVADENRDLCDYVTRLLRRWWSIEAVGDAIAAVEAIRRQRPTLMLADAAMPGLDGIGLLQALHDDPASRSIPIIVLADQGVGVESRSAGDCLVKPFSSRELIARISSRLEEHFGSAVRTQKPVRRLLNRIDVPIALLRTEGLIVENANRAYLALVGDQDAVGKRFGAPLFDAADSPLEECAGVSASGARRLAGELTIPVHRQGESEDTYWNFVLAPVTDEVHGHERHVVAIGVDVTDEVRARRQREALAAEAISANTAKDQFLAALGHELRSPLSPIATGLQLMRTKGLCSRELDIVERQVAAIMRLVDDLLDVSRIGRGRIELRKEPVEIADVVARAIETVDPLLKERRHSLTVRVPPSGLQVNVDPARMAQVIANLLTNAAKYSERGSEITVRAARDDQRLRLSVEDHGIGIAADMLPHVFEAFAQDRSVAGRSRGGLGLGLAIVRDLVGLHDGAVTVHSDGLGAGSTFCVELVVDDGDVVHGPAQATGGER
jgi:signal transduction histidine kinase